MKHLLTLMAALMLLTCCTTQADRTRMRAGLDSINQRNRNDLPFTADDVLPYIHYFDRHGTPNDLMLAHYLLGRAYHEQGEAPMALQYYQQAIDCADTTDRDCDFRQLCRVYGQMADIFYMQCLYDKQLELNALAEQYAWKSKDTLAALMIYEQCWLAYKEKGLPDSAIHVIEHVSRLYSEYGYDQQAAIALGSIVDILLETGHVDKAEKYLTAYESCQSLFDESGEIERGRELYYYIKGLLYLKKNRLDAAESCFRKELHKAKDFNNQNAGAYGLAMVYEQRHLQDSATRYYKYAYAMNDSAYHKMATDEIGQMAAMYNYTRNQEIARAKSQEAQKEKRKRQVLTFVLATFIIGSTLVFYSIIRKGKKGLEKYQQSLYERQQILKEKNALASHEAEYRQIIAEKEKKIKLLEKNIKKYGKQMYFNTANSERCMKASPTYGTLMKKCQRGELFTESDWKNVDAIIAEYLPGFDDFLASHRALLTSSKPRICQLLRLHIKTNEIANVLNTSPANISQESAKILKRLFNAKGSSKELSEKLCKIC